MTLSAKQVSGYALYLPGSWIEDHPRCQSCYVPEQVPFATKSELGLQLLSQAQSWGVPFATVVADSGSGIPSFLRALDERHMTDVCAVASDFGVRLLDEMQQANPHPVRHPLNPHPAPRHDAKAATDSLPEERWQSLRWRDGTKGTLCKHFVALRVHAGTGCARHSQTHGRSWTGPEGWLLAERPLAGEEGKPKWFFRTLPADTPLPRLGALAHLRWPIEQFYEDAKGECGLGDSQGRLWEGLHRHLALAMLTYTFLMLESLGQEEQASPTRSAAFPDAADQSPCLPSTSADLALPGSGALVDRNRTHQHFSSSQKLTE